MTRHVLLCLGLAAALAARAAVPPVAPPAQQTEKFRNPEPPPQLLVAPPPAPGLQEQQARAAAEKARALAGPSPSREAVVVPAGPGKEDRLAAWGSLPAEEAYRLFKECGVAMPAELALQLNQSLSATPWTPEMRQAGGSPGTAVPILNTAHGASYGDHGDTAVLSNYLTNVPYPWSSDCLTTGNYQANDAWYVFTLGVPTLVGAGTCASAYYDTRVGLFDSNLQQVAGNDDYCGLQSYVECCLDPGTFYVVVDGYWTYAGEYDLSVAFNACPAVSPPTRGGTDAFGYRWINSFDAEGPNYNWQDITAWGTPVTLTDDSYTTTPVDLGFAFPFYGIDRTQIYIGSNGMLNFDGAYMNSLSNGPLPDPYIYGPNDLICAFWDDLNPGAGGTIHYYSDPWYGRFIVQFTNVPAYMGTVGYTFQVILDWTGDILIQYQDVDEADVVSATVGVENDTGTDGLQVNFNGTGGAITDGSCVRLLPPHPDAGGPDAFGYTWADSRAPGGPLFEWVDISGTTNLGLTGDDQAVAVTLPFAFPFYGASHTSMIVCSNGWAGFNTSDWPDYYEMPIPTPGMPDNAVFAFWDDLYLPAGGAVHYYHDTNYGRNRAIIQWTGVPHITGYGTCTFQLILNANGVIETQYLDMPETFAASNAIGLENADGSIGLQARYDYTGCVVEDRLAMRFTPPQPRPTRGGPDGFGYQWVNSLDPAGPDYAYQEISGLGVNLGLSMDDQLVPVALPFAFPFYGTPQTQVQVCSNGWLGFNMDDIFGYYWNDPIPTEWTPNNIICPFWEDLYLPGGGAVYYWDDSAHGRVIVEWSGVPSYYANAGPYTFQVQLYSNGEIYVYYADMGNQVVNGATVGVENAAGTVGLQVNCNDAGGFIGNGVGLEIFSAAPPERIPAPITDLQITPLYFDEYTADVHISFTPVTTDIYGNPMTIETYLLVYAETWHNGLVDPFVLELPASYHAGGGDLYFGNIGWTISAYLYLIAVDSDGMVVAASADLPWRTVDEIPGFDPARGPGGPLTTPR